MKKNGKMTDRDSNPVLRKILCAVNISIVGTVFVLCTVFMNVAKRPRISEKENRMLARSPYLTVESYFSGKFTDGFTKHYNDAVPMKDEWIDVISEIRARFGVEYDGGVEIVGGLPELDV